MHFAESRNIGRRRRSRAHRVFLTIPRFALSLSLSPVSLFVSLSLVGRGRVPEGRGKRSSRESREYIIQRPRSTFLQAELRFARKSASTRRHARPSLYPEVLGIGGLRGQFRERRVKAPFRLFATRSSRFTSIATGDPERFRARYAFFLMCCSAFEILPPRKSSLFNYPRIWSCYAEMQNHFVISEDCDLEDPRFFWRNLHVHTFYTSAGDIQREPEKSCYGFLRYNIISI